MHMLANYTPQRDIPHYYPCLYPAFHDSLRHAGVPCIISLLPNLNLNGVPTYSCSAAVEENGVRNPYVNFHCTEYLGYAELDHVLGINAATREAESFEQGLQLIRNSLAQNKPFVLFGAMYHLPYNKFYHSQEYLEKRLQGFHGAFTHWLTVYGLGEDEALLYDPIPHDFQGCVSLETLDKFWKGDRWIPELTGKLEHEDAYWTYGYGVFDIERHLTHEELFELSVSSLKTIAYEYLAGRQVQVEGELHRYGNTAFTQLTADLKRMLAEGADKPSFAPYDDCLFNLRYPHFFVQQMLTDLAQQHGEPFADLALRYAPISAEIEKIGNMFRMSMMRRSQEVGFVTRTLDKLFAVAALQQEFYEHVASLFAEQPLLATAEQTAASR